MPRCAAHFLEAIRDNACVKDICIQHGHGTMLLCCSWPFPEQILPLEAANSMAFSALRLTFRAPSCGERGWSGCWSCPIKLMDDELGESSMVSKTPTRQTAHCLAIHGTSGGSKIPSEAIMRMSPPVVSPYRVVHRPKSVPSYRIWTLLLWKSYTFISSRLCLRRWGTQLDIAHPCCHLCRALRKLSKAKMHFNFAEFHPSSVAISGPGRGSDGRGEALSGRRSCLQCHIHGSFFYLMGIAPLQPSHAKLGSTPAR